MQIGFYYNNFGYKYLLFSRKYNYNYFNKYNKKIPQSFFYLRVNINQNSKEHKNCVIPIHHPINIKSNLKNNEILFLNST